VNVIIRSIKGGNAPPACGMMNVMSGQRASVPETKRLITARAVSKRYSNMGLGYCVRGVALIVPWPSQAGMHGAVGWMKIFAFRRFSSSKMGSNILSPRYRPWKLVCSVTPSAFSSSRAYFISSSDASTSGRGSEAQKPNCALRRETSSAAKSLHSLLSFLAAAESLGVRKMPGELIERMDLVMLREAISARWCSSLHSWMLVRFG